MNLLISIVSLWCSLIYFKATHHKMNSLLSDPKNSLPKWKILLNLLITINLISNSHQKNNSKYSKWIVNCICLIIHKVFMEDQILLLHRLCLEVMKQEVLKSKCKCKCIKIHSFTTNKSHHFTQTSRWDRWWCIQELQQLIIQVVQTSQWINNFHNQVSNSRQLWLEVVVLTFNHLLLDLLTSRCSILLV